MKTYIFEVVVEPDEDRWSAHCPVLLERGATSWGYTQDEALKNIQEVVAMVVESLVEHGEPIPADRVEVSDEPKVAITV